MFKLVLFLNILTLFFLDIPQQFLCLKQPHFNIYKQKIEMWVQPQIKSTLANKSSYAMLCYEYFKDQWFCSKKKSMIVCTIQALGENSNAWVDQNWYVSQAAQYSSALVYSYRSK